MKPMTFRKTSIAAAIALMMGMGLGTASAQSFGGQEAAPPAEGAAPPAAGEAPMQGESTQLGLTDQTVDTFVDAFVEVQKVRTEITAEMDGASDPEEAQAMQAEAQERMIEAVEGAGMSVEEYNEVAMALQNDPERMQEVQQRADERL